MLLGFFERSTVTDSLAFMIHRVDSLTGLILRPRLRQTFDRRGEPDGAIMARWCSLTWYYLTYFDGCGFGKYCFISFRLAWLMPLKPSHNLLVRGSNPCGGTNQLATFWSAVTCRRFLIFGTRDSRIIDVYWPSPVCHGRAGKNYTQTPSTKR